MNDLEREYRDALAWYPRAWRRSHEEALLGVLLDKAEAEGRQHMSKAEQKDLARNYRRIWLSRGLSYLLFAIAGLALLFVVSAAINGMALNAEVIVASPAIPAPPAGGSYVPLFITSQPGWVVYAVSTGVFVAAALPATLLVRRNRISNRVR